MEKAIEKNIDIVITASAEGAMIFEIKEPQKVNRDIFSEIRKELGISEIASKVIYPDNNVIESQYYFIDCTASIL